MPRRPYKKRTAKKDEIYNSLEVAKLINYIMINGKKGVAEKIVYDVLTKIKSENTDPIMRLNKAISTYSFAVFNEIPRLAADAIINSS